MYRITGSEPGERRTWQIVGGPTDHMLHSKPDVSQLNVARCGDDGRAERSAVEVFHALVAF